MLIVLRKLNELNSKGILKGSEKIITRITAPEWVKKGWLPDANEDKAFGPRYFLAGDDTPYLVMNTNSYLGLSLHPEVMAAEEKGAQQFGTGPGAVRFIAGTYAPHIELEQKLAGFHQRESAMLFSAAYASNCWAYCPL